MNVRRLLHKVEKPAVNVAEKIDANKKAESVARFGFVVNGVLHGLLGITAVAVAVAGGNGEIDQSAIFGPLSRSVVGVAVVLLMSLALIALGLWKAVQILVTKRARINRTVWYQLEEGAKAVTYTALGISLAVLAFSHDTTGGSVRSSQAMAATVLSTPLGIVVIVAIGIGLIGVGGNFVFRGVSRRFLRSIDTKTENLGRAITIAGIIGYVSKGLVFVSLGIVFIVAGITADPNRESGLDGAFKMFIRLPFGAYILMLIGAGFLCYALYSAARARFGHFRVKRHKYL